jgi:Pyruvate/2-oxoacid:ferredoxin oxidoreductase gamma subunit/GNAT superfamily N-acetyltransferase
MEIRKIEKKDAEAVGKLMENVIDETYDKEPDKIRKALKANFTGDGLAELMKDKQAAFYVVEENGEVVAFLFGWLLFNVFTIYWVYNSKEHRGKGYIRKLMEHLEKKLIETGCYKIVMYAYSKNKFIENISKFGFEKGVLLKKSMFGIEIQKLIKHIGDYENAEKERRIKIVGEAGQGIKLLSFSLAHILSQLGNEVSLNMEYDSAVRSGNISADLIFSENKIEDPIIDEADLLLKFARTRQWFPAKELIIDDTICGKKCIDCAVQCKNRDQFGFKEDAVSKFGNKVFVNMIALGKILKYLGINIMLINIEDVLPPKFVDKNVQAIKYGFSFRDAL